MNVFKDNEGYWWRIGGTLNHWHAEFTSWGRDYREESVNDTGLWWLVRPSFIIISLKYNSELQRQILEAQKHQFLHQKSSCGDLVKKNFIGRGHCPLPRPIPQWGGGHPSPHPIPLGAYGASRPSTLAPAAFNLDMFHTPSLFTPPSLHFLEICLGIHSLHSCIV